MDVVDKSSFLERLAGTGIGFDTRYGPPHVIGFQAENQFSIPRPRDIGNIARLLRMVVKIYAPAEALWIWRRSGTWLPSAFDFTDLRGGTIRGVEALGLPQADGAILCPKSERWLLPSILLLWLSIQASVDDDVFLVAGATFPVAYLDHDEDIFLDCANEQIASEYRSHFSNWI